MPGVLTREQITDLYSQIEGLNNKELKNIITVNLQNTDIKTDYTSSKAFCGGGESDDFDNNPIIIKHPGHFVENPETGNLEWVCIEEDENLSSDDDQTSDQDLQKAVRRFRNAAEMGPSDVRSQKLTLNEYYLDYLQYNSSSYDYSMIIDLCRYYIKMYQTKVLQIIETKQKISKSILDIIQIVAPAIAQHFSGLPAMAIVAALTVVLKNQLFKS